MTFRKLANGDLEYEAMGGCVFCGVRQALGLSRLEFGYLLGYTGEERNICATVARYEKGQREIPPTIERLVLLLQWFRADYGHLPDLDSGLRQPLAIVAEILDEPVRSG